MRTGMAVVALMALVGCGAGGERVEVSSKAYDVRASLSLPAEWAVESRAGDDMASFSESENPENRGWIVIWGAGGKDLATWVDTDYVEGSRMMAMGGEMLGQAVDEHLRRGAGEAVEEAFGWRELSRRPTKVGKWEAMEMVDESGGKRQMKLFVKKGNGVVEVTLSCLPGEWGRSEAVFRETLESLRVR